VIGYVPAENRYGSMTYRRTGAVASSCRPCRSGCGRTSATTNRWIEDRLLDVLGVAGVGCVAFSVLAQGLLTDRYLYDVPEGSRASRDGPLTSDMLNENNLAHIRALNDIASSRDQSLALMAIAWALRDYCVTADRCEQRLSTRAKRRSARQARFHRR
jgi:aryl-alcohol dehydrogenase-like predicted oxidoreductase